ncbi:DnaJ-like [Gracilariopsis chorda]|uniref:DnaJ-like n=1 Tax=Gracilariopsis chorda TaxID=448386 RepID=A0A2V3IIY5_9FLOR|nr:DnaJ-like [Gracilariopsis chorda]|eukprot:PXF42032.1 DnaJ-like [Gracilariopsis chorda]
MCGPTDGARDPYQVLGVPSSATPDHIRRVYKALCLKWHPDKHPPGQSRQSAETNFKNISVAYAAICDKQPRSSRFVKSYSTNSTSYNTRSSTTAHSGANKTQHFFFSPSFRTDDSAFYFDDVFDGADDEYFNPTDTPDLYDNDDQCDDAAPDSSPCAPSSRADVVYELPLTLCEYANGCVKQHRLESGSSANDSTTTTTTNCKLLRIVIKPWYRPGDRIRFRNVLANDGDVVFKLSLSAHSSFAGAPLVRGDDVLVVVRIALVDALTGCKLSLQTARGVKSLKVSAVVTPGMKRLVPNCGLPCRDGSGFGDVVVRFEVVFPRRVDDAARLRLRDVFAKLERGAAMRRTSSVFSARSLRKQDAFRDGCSRCGRADADGDARAEGAPTAADGAPGGDDAHSEAASAEGAAERAEREHGAHGGAKTRAAQATRLRSMFAKSSCKLASVFR